MTATTTERDTEQYSAGPIPVYYVVPLAANVKVYAGTIAAVQAGFAQGALGNVATQKVWGRFVQTVDNTGGAAGAQSAKIESGGFRWENSASGDLIAQADVGQRCFAADNQTAAKTSATNTRSDMGVILGVDATGVWVLSGPSV